MAPLRTAAALLALALVMAPAAAAAPARASLTDIEDEVMCPICGTLLQLSESPQAERERVFIRRLISKGETKAQIKDALVGEYGSEVLAVPDTGGFDLVAWLLPGAALLVAASAVGFGVRRWRAGGRAETAAAAEPAEAAGRLDEDLARYDL